jgi:hypothetical protein
MRAIDAAGPVFAQLVRATEDPRESTKQALLGLFTAFETVMGDVKGGRGQ